MPMAEVSYGSSAKTRLQATSKMARHSDEVTVCNRSFQTRGAAMQNARSPIVKWRVRGTTRATVDVQFMASSQKMDPVYSPAPRTGMGHELERHVFKMAYCMWSCMLHPPCSSTSTTTMTKASICEAQLAWKCLFTPTLSASDFDQ